MPRIFIGLIFVALIIIGIFVQKTLPFSRKSFDLCLSPANVQILDGDTLLIKSQHLKIRLLGIDAPEMDQEPHGQNSKQYLASLIQTPNRRKICCEKGKESHDRYGRILAYCWADDIFLNASMLSAGQAMTLFYGDKNIAHKNYFLQLEDRAEENELGIYSSEEPLAEMPYFWRKRKSSFK